MSDTHGFQARPNPGNNQSFGGDNGVKGPTRDMWDQPIKQEPAPKTVDANNPGGNDDSINVADIDTIWDQVKKEGSKPQDQTTTVVDTTPKKTAQEQMTEYLVSQGLDPIVLSDADKEELKAGNFDGIVARLNDKIVKSHTKALSSANVMIKEAVAAAIKEATTASQSTEAGVRNLAELHRALPFTKDKLIGPIAQTVMQRFLDRGANTEQAIEGVKKYYQHTNKLTNPEFQVNGNRNGNFSAGGRAEEQEGDGWLDMLRPKRG